MVKRLKKNRFTGLEITKSAVLISQIENRKDGWQYICGQSKTFPEDTLQFAYKSENVLAPEVFKDAVKQTLQLIGKKVDRVGISLPNEIVKVFIQHYKEVPAAQDELDKMIAFWTAKTVRLPQDSLKISYQYITHSKSLGHRFLVAITNKTVIEQYLSILKRINIKSEFVGPAAFNQFNFYSDKLPSEGRIGFLGICDNFYTLMIFQNAGLVYYQGVKIGLANIHVFFESFDRILQHYLRNNPEKAVEQLFIGSQVGLHRELSEVFSNLSDMDVEVVNEMELIDFDRGASGETNEIDIRKVLSQFGSAIGAAQGLARIWR